MNKENSKTLQENVEKNAEKDNEEKKVKKLKKENKEEKAEEKVEEKITKQIEPKIGKIRNGRMVYKGGPVPTFVPSYPGYTSIFVMIRDKVENNEYGALSPYSIRVPVPGYPDGVIHENYWQFLKVYPIVYQIDQTASRSDKRIVWRYHTENHLKPKTKNPTKPEDWELLGEWYNWNKKGFENQDYVRYPVGSHPRITSSCKFALAIKDDGTVDPNKRMGYVESRKKTYGKAYCENVMKHSHFDQLKQRLMNGENLLIIEVDGPHEESAEYYKEKYGWELDKIDNGTIEATKENLKVLINDTKHPFGHGYCLSMALHGQDIIDYVSE